MNWIPFVVISLVYSGFVAAQTVSFMTYNIKLDYPKEGENSWTNRKGFLIQQIKFHGPDLMGVQEAMPNQMDDLQTALIDYKSIGVGRDDGNRQGEFSAIFYRSDKFMALNSGTFWLSETPDTPSLGWDAACNRICTYGQFQERESGKVFWVFNTHLDHVGNEARAKGLALIQEKMKVLNHKNEPLVLVGDFNLEPEAQPIQHLKEYLHDSYDNAKLNFNGYGSFNGFDFFKPATRRIDYIFLNNQWVVNKHAILTDSFKGKFPSDHFPVFVECEFKRESTPVDD